MHKDLVLFRINCNKATHFFYKISHNPNIKLFFFVQTTMKSQNVQYSQKPKTTTHDIVATDTFPIRVCI